MLEHRPTFIGGFADWATGINIKTLTAVSVAARLKELIAIVLIDCGVYNQKYAR
ncbi:hypothetical protein AVDCRST_MAG81-2956 [uncultured Synechococcales cyanobacterium]|uniref:Uncharacterized protein n=1 Tax=uncultured Synechococcales cyanobacterium TaxID=1936017 RepID=A0A6J4V9Y3_9CYAN|nr:hypothetical protein AVDCRST_MAG81-2956 [uncultured Synechococcales cyanobacterium]